MNRQWGGSLYASTAEISDICIFYGMVIILERTNDLLNAISTTPEP